MRLDGFCTTEAVPSHLEKVEVGSWYFHFFPRFELSVPTHNLKSGSSSVSNGYYTTDITLSPTSNEYVADLLRAIMIL